MTRVAGSAVGVHCFRDELIRVSQPMRLIAHRVLRPAGSTDRLGTPGTCWLRFVELVEGQRE